MTAHITDTSDDKRHFFISFNKADRDWATWIAWVLEEKGYSVFFQDWDCRGRAPPPEKNARIAVAAAPLSRIALLIDSWRKLHCGVGVVAYFFAAVRAAAYHCSPLGLPSLSWRPLDLTEPADSGRGSP